MAKPKDPKAAKLTFKQERFCHEFVKHGNAKKAAADAGYSGSDHGIEVTASRLLKKPHLAKLIEKLTEPIWDLAKRRLREIIDEKGSGNVQACVRALELCAKIEGRIAPIRHQHEHVCGSSAGAALVARPTEFRIRYHNTRNWGVGNR